MIVAEVTVPNTIQPGTRPRPVPGPQEVLIEVYAAGINGHDLHHLHKGSHPINPGETDIPGLEAAGIIAEVGSEVTRWKIGDRVCALMRGGGYAEFALAHEGSVLPIPAGLSFAQAACLPETMFTVWSNVVVDCGLKPGETFLMNGGTSGIGVTAIQIFSALGYTVFATARGEKKARFCEELGAVRGIDYETESFPAVIKEYTSNKGVDVILDIVGGDYLMQDLDAMAHGGRLTFINAARGMVTPINISQLMYKQLHVTGSLLRPRSPAFKASVADALREKIWPLVESAVIKPVLDKTYPLSEAAAALAHLEARAHIGKVVLTVK